jgi:GrpB-like predicted nucleotidyltransferase (UPF0157 family)
MLIHLADHHPEWPAAFAAEADRIRAVLDGRALLVEHVGSTSVPGLAAKPIIDIVLAVADSSDEAEYLAALESAGYRFHLREPQWHEHRLFKSEYPAVHLHVFSSGCPEIERMLRFRDHLRIDAEDRDLYERTKRSLAERDWSRGQNYADAKTPIVEMILKRANATDLEHRVRR